MRPRLLVAAVLALAIAGCGSSSSSTTTSTTSAGNSSTATSASSQPVIGPEGVLLEQGSEIAPASTTTQGATVDGVQCAPVEQLAYHIHAHLQVYVDGQPRQLPGAIGLVGPIAQQTPNGQFFGAQQCYYWMHTHASDGIIHIESPTQHLYTLGNFFDEWGQPLSAAQVGPATGKVTAYVDGKPWSKSPRAIELGPHTVVQLDVGTPVVSFQTASFGNQGL
jgi:hypothetical protein